MSPWNNHIHSLLHSNCSHKTHISLLWLCFIHFHSTWIVILRSCCRRNIVLTDVLLHMAGLYVRSAGRRLPFSVKSRSTFSRIQTSALFVLNIFSRIIAMFDKIQLRQQNTTSTPYGSDHPRRLSFICCTSSTETKGWKCLCYMNCRRTRLYNYTQLIWPLWTTIVSLLTDSSSKTLMIISLVPFFVLK